MEAAITKPAALLRKSAQLLTKVLILQRTKALGLGYF